MMEIPKRKKKEIEQKQNQESGDIEMVKTILRGFKGLEYLHSFFKMDDP